MINCSTADPAPIFSWMSPRASQGIAGMRGNPRTPPGAHFNGMIAPILPYAITGVIWYQGESDALNSIEAAQYATRLQQFITDVNGIYGIAQIPFFVVQIQQSPVQVGTVAVQNAELLTSVTLPYSAYTHYVETGDIAVNFDTHHIDAASLEALGLRIAGRIKV
jgi:sialate O-acetylesterase